MAVLQTGEDRPPRESEGGEEEEAATYVPLQQGQLARVDPRIYRCATVTPLRPATRPNYQQGGSSGSGHTPSQPSPPADEARATTHTTTEHTATTGTAATDATANTHNPNEGGTAASTMHPTAAVAAAAAANREEWDDTPLVQTHWTTPRRSTAT